MSDFNVQHLADLARVELSQEELTMIEPQLATIIEYIGKLSKLDTSHVSPFVYVNDLKNVFRADEISVCDPDVMKRCLEAFPERTGDLLKVQGVFESQEEDL